jgi:hypothetical protein
MFHDLLRAVLDLGNAALQSESAACDALARVRFPNGVRCPKCRAACDRVDARVTCRGGERHSFTLLIGTPLATKTRPRVRPLLLAIRAFAISARSISTRELARDVNMPHATLWRHLLTLRAILPPAPNVKSPCATPPTRLSRDARIGAAFDPAKRTLAGARVAVQAARTWLNGTFHGVKANWLSLYLRELAARWAYGAPLVAGALLELLIDGGAALVFREVRAFAARLQDA